MTSRNTGVRRLARVDYRLVGAAALVLSVLAGGSIASAAPITFSYTGGFQSFTATDAGTYAITAYGAQGGNARTGPQGGLGAEIGGSFFLTAGEVLQIAVGGAGVSGPNFAVGGGGGGSFVVAPGTIPLVIAGGGGGASFSNAGGASGGAGQISQSGGNGNGIGGGAGGSNGTGGAGGSAGGGGGGGFTTAGGAGSSPGGSSYLGGLAGGVSNSFSQSGSGGFGGGGAGDFGGGGGGGYSGGGGGYGSGQGRPIAQGGGGGGSFLALGAINPTRLAGVQSGNGLVTIEYLAPVIVPPTAVPEPASLALVGVGVVGAAAFRRRRAA